MNIKTDKLIKVKLRIGWWHGNHTAHGLEEDVASQQGGDAEAYKVQLKAMPPEFRASLSDISRAMDKAWKMATFPFEDNGWRVMRADRYDKLLSRINELAAKRREIVDEMVARHGEIVQYAQKALGKAWRDGMVPPADAMKAQFNHGTWLRPRPIDNVGSRVMGISDETQKAIEQSLVEALEEGASLIKGEVKGTLGRLFKDLLDRLGKFQHGNGTRYGALLGSLKESAARFREIGILPDEVDALLKKAEAIGETASKDIRKHAGVRKAVKKELESVSQSLEELFA